MDKGDSVVEFVQGYIEEHGFSPNFKEIMAACGLSSTSHASYWVDILIEEGRLTKAPNIARSIRVVA